MEATNICIIGLGYVGLPLAVEFGKKYNTIGFDINSNRIKELNDKFDRTLEINKSELDLATKLVLTTVAEDIRQANIFIVTVPTPVDSCNKPDLTPLIKASETIGHFLKPGDIVIYESTVYPGATEEQCVPILEKVSGLKFNIDFFAGYSPERINPGDKNHTVANILKVTSGSTPDIATKIDNLYASIITAGTFKASSIKVAEAAKVIENSQRDINIAFVNELAKIFNLLNIDTHEVLAAAGTKWNFLKFTPGLVGGHCIGVDPYYLAQKAGEVGYHPEIILAGRRINDGMGKFVTDTIIKLMIKKDMVIKGSSVLIMGFTFKENCPDVRNTRVIDIVNEFKSYDTNIDVIDPWANKEEVFKVYHITIEKNISIEKKYDVIVAAVSHNEFQNIDLQKYKKDKCIIYDIKGTIPKTDIDARL